MRRHLARRARLERAMVTMVSGTVVVVERQAWLALRLAARDHARRCRALDAAVREGTMDAPTACAAKARAARQRDVFAEGVARVAQRVIDNVAARLTEALRAAGEV